ncbi:MAG TPA: c-type cytochrome [Vulgatibacteraceae bacterium]|nr:c-type cytochrome [Vulgatibacteraceae bacterium]
MRSVAWAAVVVAVVGLSVAARPAAAQQQSGEEKEAASQPAAEAKNPFTGQPEAIQAGRKLYMKWNCYGCHGTMGGGGMGPSLIDSEWRYGGEDAKVFESIRNGRPNGMPAFTMLTDEETWQLIAYIRSLYKGDPDKVVW